MQTKSGFWQRLRTRNKILLAGFGAAVFLFAFFVFTIEAVHYTESTTFCSSCHDVMEPEIVTHQISAHAEVDCGACHVGEGAASKIYYKVSAVRYLWSLPLQMYSRPLASARESMRSTDEICAGCHAPEYLHSSKLIVDNNYGLDAANSLTRLLLAMKVEATGDELAARSTGAHWHQKNPVYFIATDEFRQTIPWVQVEKNGETVVYSDPDADPVLWTNADAEKHKMDCIDCHSREGHGVKKPGDAIDDAISHGMIAADLPAVKASGLAALDQRYASDAEALAAIDTTVRAFYQTDYPDILSTRAADVDNAIAQFQQIYNQTQFPHMRVYWDTYPENTGHQDFPGCFRCHSGSMLNEAGEAIPAECNLCHAIPQVVQPDMPVELASNSIENAPASHQSSLWIAEHRFQFDATCDDCHTVADPGGSSNVSTCSNSACHGMEWSYLDLDNPAVLALVQPERMVSARRLPRIPHPVVDAMDCQQCHGPEKFLAYPEDHADYAVEECTQCHLVSQEVLAEEAPAVGTPLPAEALPGPTATLIPAIVHPVAGNESCLNCHAVDGNIQPAPDTHRGFTNQECGDCHRLAPEFVPLFTPIPEATPTAPPTELPAVAATAEPLEEPLEESGAEPTAEPEEASGAETTGESDSLAIVSHTIAGNENCMACHAVDSNISPAPLHHFAYTNDGCEECHHEPPEATTP